jgi:hypothetical protein
MEEADNLEKEIQDAEKLLDGATQEIKATEAEVKTEVKAEETTSTEQATPETNEEEDVIPHGERSRLGRKVKRLEDTLSEIKSSLDFLKEKTVPQQAQEPEEEEIDLPEGATSEEIKEFIRKREDRLLTKIESKTVAQSKQIGEKKQKYSKEYTRMVEDMLDPDEDADIYKLMTDTKDLTFNQVHSGFEDAKNDFLINYRAATKSVLNKAKPVTKTTVANKPSQIPTGVNVPSGTKLPSKVVDISKWSVEEQNLAKNFSAEELASMGI